MLTKNQETTLQIIDMSQSGEGIGKIADGPDQGFTVFVKDTVPGDTVRVLLTKVKKHYGYGKLLEVLQPSADRVTPPCPVARQCGGCQLQMMAYPAQLRLKEKIVKADLERIGSFSDAENLMRPIIGMDRPFRYRNKALYPIGEDRDGNPVAGFYAGRTHSIIPCTDCLLGDPENQNILEQILAWMRENHVPAYQEKTGHGLVRHVLIRVAEATGERIVCVIVNGRKIPASEELVNRLRKIPGMTGITWSKNTERTNVALTGPVQVLWGQSYITDILHDEANGREVKFRISPASFYQVNHRQTEKLYAKALAFADLSGQETVMDLYCGIGTISLFLAGRAKQVIGVEIVPAAVRDAKQNAKLNGIDHAVFYEGKAEEVVPRLYAEEGIHADVVVVDPPRKGCDEKLLETMVSMAPKRIVYVSCDPATLARDLRYLADHGYKVVCVQPEDQFGCCVNVENVVRLDRIE